MTAWLTIIGIGEDGFDGLSAKAKHAISKADTIIGSNRTLAFLPAGPANRIEWPQPFSAVIDQLKPLRQTPTVILATGDPMNFGAARKVLEFIPRSEVDIIPAISAFSLAAARMGWSLPDCDCFTIHGRPAANLEMYMQPSSRLLVLTQDGNSVAEACRRLTARGFGDSQVSVLENLGGPSETTTTFAAGAMPARAWSPLNTLAIHCIASAGAKVWSRVGGLPDEAFQHDGQLTKREVRAATLAALAPAPDELLWDIGAGCGSVGIEWMRSIRGCQTIAFEYNESRCQMLAANCDALGTPRLQLVKGRAPEVLAGQPAPHAVFIGGGIGDDGVFHAGWTALRPAGRLVANCVSLEGESHLIDLQARYGGDLVRMDVSHMTHIGALRAMRPRMSVLQWRVSKQ